MPIDEKHLESQKSLAKRQRNFQAYTKQYLDDPRHSAQVIGQLHQLTKGMSKEQAALQILQLAEIYRSQGKWGLYESTLADLVTRFPFEPSSTEAMKNLLHLWSGYEPSWQRLQKHKTVNHQFDYNSNQIEIQMKQAVLFAESNPTQYQLDFYKTGNNSVKLASHEASLRIGRSTLKEERMKHWHQQAFRLADLVRLSAPQLYLKPEFQFPLAKLLRENGESKFAEHFYQTMQSDQENQTWNKTAAAELWLSSSSGQSTKNVYRCAKTEVKPYLDGLLSDECWLNAEMISLIDDETNNEKPKNVKNRKNSQKDHAFAMLAYDTDYLYIAYSIPHHEKLPSQEIKEGGRTHDADLTKYDRIHLDLDIDRDYSTWYSLYTDQRGQTSDACWEDPHWNPKWYVKTLNTETHWRTEIAIPFRELTDTPPVKSTSWAASFVRIIPTVGIESWSHPSSIEPSPANFGLIRFQ